jgi:hypothetical protein
VRKSATADLRALVSKDGAALISRLPEVSTEGTSRIDSTCAGLMVRDAPCGAPHHEETDTIFHFLLGVLPHCAEDERTP